jgi:hypothetical protein
MMLHTTSVGELSGLLPSWRLHLEAANGDLYLGCLVVRSVAA